MSPGYYSVMLDTPKVRAELTATERVGVHRYTFPASDQAYILVDLHHAQLNNGKSLVASGELESTGSDSIAGGSHHQCLGPRTSTRTLRCRCRSSRRRWFSSRMTRRCRLAEPRVHNLKCVMYFDTKAGEQILVKTGISGVSAESAAENIRAEVPAWDFNGARTAAEGKWRAQLGKINATFATDTQEEDLLHRLLPYVARADALRRRQRQVSRQWITPVHTLPAGAENYTTFSLWDTFRAAHPAYTLLEAATCCRSL